MQNRHPPEEIVPALAHPNRMVNRYAAMMLDIRQEANQLVPYLAAMLQSPSAPARQAAAFALGASARPFSTQYVTSPQAITIDPQTVESLTVALRDPDALVRATSAGSLSNLCHFADQAAQYRDDDAPNPLRVDAVVLPLIQTLQDSAAPVRAQAACALRTLAVPTALPSLTPLLHDPDQEVRTAAAFAAGDLGAPQALPLLLDILRNGSWESRQQAATSLRRLGDPQAVPTLMAALTDPSRRVQQQAAVALGCLGDPQSVPALLNALEDVSIMFEERRSLREDLVTALGRLGDRLAVPAVVRALDDYDKNVRAAAMSALIKLGGPQVEDALICLVEDNIHLYNPNIRQAINAMGLMGVVRAMPILRLVIEEGHEHLASPAARALRQLGDTITADDMRTWLNSPDADYRLRAVLALRALVDRDALPQLLHALTDLDPAVRAAAARQLAHLHDRSAIPALTTALDDEDTETRQAARSALDSLT